MFNDHFEIKFYNSNLFITIFIMFFLRVIGYTQLKSPDTIRTPKLSGRRRGKYYGGGPLTIPHADN
jgi:hypothetical protein